MRTSVQQSVVSAQHSARSARCSPFITRRPAFTLVELAVVFAVIAILAVLVTWASRKYIQDAKAKQTRLMMQSWKLAMDAYKEAGNPELQPPQYYDRDDAVIGPVYLPCPPSGKDYGQPQIRTDYYRDDTPNPRTPLTQPIAHCPCASHSPIDRIWAVDNLTVATPPNNYAQYPNPQDRKVYGAQALYQCLMREPRSKQILNKMSASSFSRGSKLLEFLDSPADYFMSSNVDVTTLPCDATAILDGWGRPLYYGRDIRESINAGRPYLQSAGADGVFGNDDDLYSFKE